MDSNGKIPDSSIPGVFLLTVPVVVEGKRLAASPVGR